MTQDVSSVAPFSQLAEEYGLWFFQLVRFMLYPAEGTQRPSPPALIDSISGLDENFLKSGAVEPLKNSQLILHEMSEKILSSGKFSSVSEYDSFWQIYEGFFAHLLRLEKDMLLSDFGIDRATGLRSVSVMMLELERELERRSRKGQPFSIAMMRIDDPALRGDNDARAHVAHAILTTIRSFDDAYLSGEGEFLVSLKHSDSTGGLKFVTRFKGALRENGHVNFTVSSCVAEPLPGDELKDLLANVRADLDEIAGMGQGGSGQYEEMSPLNRFLQGLKEEE